MNLQKGNSISQFSKVFFILIYTHYWTLVCSNSNASCFKPALCICFQVLTPLRGVSGALPKLLPRLEQMPDYSIFRGYIIVSMPETAHYCTVGLLNAIYIWNSISLSFVVVFLQQQYNLETEIEAASTYTIFAPSNDAIENYLKNKRSASLVCISFLTFYEGVSAVEFHKLPHWYSRTN